MQQHKARALIFRHTQDSTELFCFCMTIDVKGQSSWERTKLACVLIVYIKVLKVIWQLHFSCFWTNLIEASSFLQTLQVLVAKGIYIQFWVNLVANEDLHKSAWITFQSCLASPSFCKTSWNLCRCSVDATVSVDVVLCFQSCRSSVYTVYTQCQRRGEISQNLDGIMILLQR